MRLIDADAFLEKSIKERRFFIYSEDIIHDGFEVSTVYKDLIDAINEMPTIEAEPVKRGKWEFDVYTGKPFCTRCGHEPYRKSDKELPNYCPDCGARMDGE